MPEPRILLGIVLAGLGAVAAIFPGWFGPFTGGPEPPVDVYHAIERRDGLARLPHPSKERGTRLRSKWIASGPYAHQVTRVSNVRSPGRTTPGRSPGDRLQIDDVPAQLLELERLDPLTRQENGDLPTMVNVVSHCPPHCPLA